MEYCVEDGKKKIHPSKKVGSDKMMGFGCGNSWKFMENPHGAWSVGLFRGIGKPKMLMLFQCLAQLPNGTAIGIKTKYRIHNVFPSLYFH